VGCAAASDQAISENTPIGSHDRPSFFGAEAQNVATAMESPSFCLAFHAGDRKRWLTPLPGMGVARAPAAIPKVGRDGQGRHGRSHAARRERGVLRLADPATHAVDDMPFLLAGGGGGLEGNRLLDFKGSSHNDLLVSIANLFGEPVTSFGDPQYCTGPLSDL
jgi:hypothetical protein